MCRSHCYRKHEKELTDEVRSDSVTVDSMTEQDMDTNDEPLDEPQPENTDHHDSHREADRQQKAALFILKATEERSLTQDTLDGMLEDITCKCCLV